MKFYFSRRTKDETMETLNAANIEQKVHIKRRPKLNQAPDQKIVTLNLQDLTVCLIFPLVFRIGEASAHSPISYNDTLKLCILYFLVEREKQ